MVFQKAVLEMGHLVWLLWMGNAPITYLMRVQKKNDEPHCTYDQ